MPPAKVRRKSGPTPLNPGLPADGRPKRRGRPPGTGGKKHEKRKYVRRAPVAPAPSELATRFVAVAGVANKAALNELDKMIADKRVELARLEKARASLAHLLGLEEPAPALRVVAPEPPPEPAPAPAAAGEAVAGRILPEAPRQKRKYTRRKPIEYVARNGKHGDADGPAEACPIAKPLLADTTDPGDEPTLRALRERMLRVVARSADEVTVPQLRAKLGCGFEAFNEAVAHAWFSLVGNEVGLTAQGNAAAHTKQLI